MTANRGDQAAEGGVRERFLSAFALALVEGVQLQEFLNWSRNPFVLLLNVVALVLVVFHAVTWFNLAPKAMVVRWRGQRVPGFWIAASNYAAWVAVSAARASRAGTRRRTGTTGPGSSAPPARRRR